MWVNCALTYLYINPSPTRYFTSIRFWFFSSPFSSTHYILSIGQKMSRPGDWNCRSCQHLNFQRRDSCQRCGDVKSGGGGLDFGAFNGGRLGGGGSSFGFGSATTGSDVRPGDWMSFLLLEAADLTLKCLAPGEVSDWEMAAPALVVVGGLDGNLEIGFVPGTDATSITLLAEWNVSDAMPQETHTREKKSIIQFLALLAAEREREKTSPPVLLYYFALI
ncbi:hypothetical protein ACLB2K_063012 [Fragaria x ananassa]